MECSVCYDSAAKCKLVCGHEFCHSCVKSWYVKCQDDATCPMCRGTFYFRGMRHHLKKWDEEVVEQQRQDIWAEVVEEILEAGGDEFDLEIAEWRASVCDDAYIILDDDILMTSDWAGPPEYYTRYTFQDFLFVEKQHRRVSKTRVARGRSNWLRV